MTRLQAQLRRLYLHPDTADLLNAQGQVRAMMLELARPADWGAVSRLWQAAQQDLALPAPAIAVNGVDGLQLWFSLSQPTPAAEARTFLEALCQRHLPEAAPQRIRLLPPADTATSSPAALNGLLPTTQVQEDQWSAFVAPDLAPVFADTPWLDVQPNEDGQAELLARLGSIQPADWQAALARLAPAQPPTAAGQGTPPAGAAPAPQQVCTAARPQDPRHFLLSVMNDSTVALSLRIEAAKALLPHTGPP